MRCERIVRFCSLTRNDCLQRILGTLVAAILVGLYVTFPIGVTFLVCSRMPDACIQVARAEPWTHAAAAIGIPAMLFWIVSSLIVVFCASCCYSECKRVSYEMHDIALV
jgi:hypothetical protein